MYSVAIAPVVGKVLGIEVEHAYNSLRLIPIMLIGTEDSFAH